MGQRESVSLNPREIYQYLNLIKTRYQFGITEPVYIIQRKTIEVINTLPSVKIHSAEIHNVSPESYTALKDCLLQNYRFIVVPVFLLNYHILQGHMNAMIIDTQTKEVERFEPYGTKYKNIILRNIDIDQYIQNYLKNYLLLKITQGSSPNHRYYTYHPPREYCSRGPQAREIWVPRGWFRYKGGFCAYWVLYYVAMRLNNPDSTRNQIIKYFDSFGISESFNQIVKFRRKINLQHVDIHEYK